MPSHSKAYAKTLRAVRWARSQRVEFTKYDMAEAIGVSVYSATRLLREMHREGFVSPMSEPRPRHLTEWMSL